MGVRPLIGLCLDLYFVFKGFLFFFFFGYVKFGVIESNALEVGCL